MKLCDMAVVYAEAGRAAKRCIVRLEEEYITRGDESEKRLLRGKIRRLYAIRREMLDIAELTENYYRRDYVRNDRYTL